MPDTAPDAPVARPRKTIGQRLRKMVVVVGLLFAAWVVFAQAIPRSMFSFGTAPATKDGSVPLLKHSPDTETIKAKDEQIDAMKERVDQLEAKLKTLEDVATAPAKPAADSAETNDKIEKMQAKIDALLQMPHTSSTVDDERVAHLEDTISKQEEALRTMQSELTDMQAKGTHDVTLITAFTSLKDAVLRGAPYTSQLGQLTPLVQDARSQEMLSQLKPMAEQGAGTLQQLQADFAAILPKALVAGKGNALERNLHSLIRIRKVGEQQKGSDDESILARAEAKLGRGDIEGSLKETALLSPPAASLFAPWNSKAQDVVRIATLMDSLQLALLQGKAKAEMAPAAGKKEEAKHEKPKPEAAPVPVPEAPKEEAKPEAAPAPEQKPEEDNAVTKKPEALPDIKPTPAHSE